MTIIILSSILPQKQPPMVVDLVAYSHVQIDRTAVLLDVWSQEVTFQKNKKRLIDCYMEIYNHVWSVEEKRKLAQVRHPKLLLSFHF